MRKRRNEFRIKGQIFTGVYENEDGYKNDGEKGGRSENVASSLAL